MLTIYWKHYPLTLFITAVVIVLSLYPIGEIEFTKGVPLSDKWTHMVMYAGLTGTIWFEYWRRHDRILWHRVLCWAIAVPILMSGILELLQEYATTYRSGEWLDLVANSIGVMIGALIGLLLMPHLKKWLR